MLLDSFHPYTGKMTFLPCLCPTFKNHIFEVAPKTELIVSFCVASTKYYSDKRKYCICWGLFSSRLIYIWCSSVLLCVKENVAQCLILYTLWLRGVRSGCGYLAGLIVGFFRLMGLVDSKKNIEYDQIFCFNTRRKCLFCSVVLLLCLLQRCIPAT